MRTLFLVAALLAAVALCRETPSYCTNSQYYDLPNDGFVYSQTDNVAHTWCYKFTMNPAGKSYAWVSLRRRVRFNSSSSTLFFCAKDDLSKISTCSYSNSYYNFYAESKSTIYGRIDYTPYGVDKSGYVYFDIKNFAGSSASAWSGLCPSGNCRNHGACLLNTSCWCDQGYDNCTSSSDLADWIVYLIVVLVLVFVFLPIIIVIICCCCCAACAAGAAAAAAR